MKQRITIERTFQATLEDVWELWTTKDGIESWWGPEGFRVEVRQIDLRVGGALLYTMIAAGPEQIAYMEREGRPVRTDHRNDYTDVQAPKRLAYQSPIDFVPGVAVYDIDTVVELEKTKQGVKMLLTFDALHDEQWTRLMTMGWQSEVGKLANVLAARTVR